MNCGSEIEVRKSNPTKSTQICQQFHAAVKSFQLSNKEE